MRLQVCVGIAVACAVLASGCTPNVREELSIGLHQAAYNEQIAARQEQEQANTNALQSEAYSLNSINMRQMLDQPTAAPAPAAPVRPFVIAPAAPAPQACSNVAEEAGLCP